MATRPQLKVEKRTVLGKKSKKLRKSGILPANIYGKGLQSMAVQVPTKDFETLFKAVGETGLVDVMVDGEARPALIKNLQIHPVTHAPLHAEFHQVNLKEKVKTMVPVAVVGEPKAVTDKVGLLLQTMSEVEVEALPTDLPEHIEVNVEPLAAVDEQITVGDLKIPAGVEILTDKAQVVVKISELVSEEAKEQAAAEAAAAEAAKATSDVAKAEGAEAVEGEPAEGEAQKEEMSEEQKTATTETQK